MTRRQGSWKQLSAALIVACAVAAAFAGPTKTQSPVAGQPADSQLFAFAAPVPLDLISYSELKDRQQLTLTDFTLEDGTAASLELTQFNVFTADARVVVGTSTGDIPMERPEVALFRGHITGEPDSHVFLSVSPFGVYGAIDRIDGTRVITSGSSGSGLQPIIYNLATLPEGAIDWQPFTCSADLLPVPGVDVDMTDWTLRSARSPECQNVALAIDTDWEFTGNLFGGDTEASASYATSLLGAVAEIYRRDFQTNLVISYLRVWSNSNDPWDQSDSVSQLYQFRDYWNAYMGDVDRNITHMLSGRGLGGGVAYVGAVCRSLYSYAVSGNINGSFPYPLQDNHWNNWDVVVVAHETGHNFGAPHTHETYPPIDNCGNGDCTDAAEGTIMSYCHTCTGGMTNISLHFHRRIIDEEVMPYLAANSQCLRDGTPEFLTALEGQLATLGEPVTLAANVYDPSGGTPTYQWRKDGVDLSDGGTISGATTDALAIASAALSDTGDYDVVVMNTCGSATSDPARLTVSGGLGDLNCDGMINNFDIDAFVTAVTEWYSYKPFYPDCDISLADFNGDGLINNFDIDQFVHLLTGD